ncbi:hypothetical protein E4U58_004712 [Claviceps cyperi]|nr:hypothetical protein E4U58_004712 [Claviceps cyperi]
MTEAVLTRHGGVVEIDERTRGEWQTIGWTRLVDVGIEHRFRRPCKLGRAEGGERDKEDEASEDNEYDGEQVGAIVTGELKMYDAGRLGLDSCQT